MSSIFERLPTGRCSPASSLAARRTLHPGAIRSGRPTLLLQLSDYSAPCSDAPSIPLCSACSTPSPGQPASLQNAVRSSFALATSFLSSCFHRIGSSAKSGFGELRDLIPLPVPPCPSPTPPNSHPPSTMPSAGDLIWTSLTPTFKMMITCGLGFWLTKKGLFPPPASRGFSQVSPDYPSLQTTDDQLTSSRPSVRSASTSVSPRYLIDCLEVLLTPRPRNNSPALPDLLLDCPKFQLGQYLSPWTSHHDRDLLSGYSACLSLLFVQHGVSTDSLLFCRASASLSSSAPSAGYLETSDGAF